MSTSFMSERSAELILVPQLITLIKDTYPTITPLFYWRSREGNKMSQQSFQDQSIKVLILYARRPKVEYIGSGQIEIKLNELLFRRTELYATAGMPVIAGCPIADKLENLQMGVPCIWLKLTPGGYEETITVNVSRPVIQSQQVNTISRDDILNMIAAAKNFSWPEALKVIDSVRRENIMSNHRSFRYGVYGDVYKPVYFLIHETRI